MDLGVFYEVVVPLLEVRGTAMIAISTLLGSFNFYSELFELKDERGQPVFNTFRVGHERRPPWKPEETFDKVKALMKDKAMFEREILGRISDAAGAAFNPRLLKEFFEAPPLEEPHDINDDIIYVGCDPNGGVNATNTTGSECAVVSFFISRGTIVVCGLDYYDTVLDEDAWVLVEAHFAALRALPCNRNRRIKFRFIGESNYANWAQLLAKLLLEQCSDVEIVCQYQHAYGIFTLPFSPRDYQMRMASKLHDRAIVYHHHIVCANPFQSATMTHEERLAVARAKFELQAKRFKTVVSMPKSIMSAIKQTASGQAFDDGKRNPHANDDMWMVFMFSVFYYYELLSDPEVARGHLRNRDNILVFERRGVTPRGPIPHR